MGRCGCGADQQCLSTNPGNLASYDETGCLYVAEFIPLFGEANQPVPVDLVTLADSTWTDTGLSIIIPAAGTFELTADAFVLLHVDVADPGGLGGGTGFVTVLFRLWNDTTSVVVPNTQVTLLSAGSNLEGQFANSGGATVHANVTTTGPNTIKMQVMRINITNAGVSGTPISISALNAAGTSVRFTRLM